jgi:hypothetical protein
MPLLGRCRRAGTRLRSSAPTDAGGRCSKRSGSPKRRPDPVRLPAERGLRPALRDALGHFDKILYVVTVALGAAPSES